MNWKMTNIWEAQHLRALKNGKGGDASVETLWDLYDK